MRSALCTAVVLLVAAVAKPLVAQSQSAQALSWFGLGLKEKDSKKKIALYSKAIELDPLLVEAHYNLGLAYKQERNYAFAEQSLQRALNVRQGKLDNDTKLKVLYELAGTKRKLGKLAECEQALRNAKSLPGNQAIRVSIALELGRILSQQARFEEALVELREGRLINPARAGEFDVLLISAQESVELQKLYDSAEKASASGNLHQARSLYGQILTRSPGFKDAKGKLAQVDSLIEVGDKQQSFAALYERAQKYGGEGNLEMAVSTYENLIQQAGSYKDAGAKLQKTREQMEQKQLADRLESEYAAGLALLKAQDWTRAVVAFEKVQAQDRDFRDVRRKLAEAQRGLERESTESILARFYADGVSAMNRNDLPRALAAFEKVRKLNPDYRDAVKLRTQIEAQLAQEAGGAVDAAVRIGASLDSLYRAAVTAYAKGDHTRAVMTFEQLQAIQPNYRDVAERLTQSQTSLGQLATANPATANAKGYSFSGSFYIYGTIAAIIAGPLFGFMMFSPSVKARLCLLKGDYKGAAQIYEKVLARNPDRVKLYPALANLYLLMGRHDESALKVYKTILNLNLATNNRDEITATVGQHYLSEGRTDSDALGVLENLLKAEQRKQGKTGQQHMADAKSAA
jgi:tetratricopeptide (TPR) repeat protein